jgi:RNA polymerase sigma-70 factor (ECF subfamily)
MSRTEKNPLAAASCDALVARARSGDEAAVNALLVAARSSMHAYLSGRLRARREDIEDILQEALLNVWKGLPTFRAESLFGTWCCAIARNAGLNRLKAIGRDRSAMSWDDLVDGGNEAIASHRDAVDVASAEQHMVARQRLAQLAAAIDRLEPTLREALALRDESGLDYDTIAAVLDVPVGTVRSRLHRARRALDLDIGN